MNKHKDLQEEDILDEKELLWIEYRKNVRRTAGALFITAGILLIFGLLPILLSRYSAEFQVWPYMVLAIVVYISLGFWAKHEPAKAIIAGLCFFLVCQLILVYLNTGNLYTGLILKLLMIIILLRGLYDGREAKRVLQKIIEQDQE